MKLFQDETFGPIMAIRVVRDAEEAIELANDSEFALSASVWTGNTEGGKKIAQRLRTGTVMVNDLISGFAIAEAPHGGGGFIGWGRQPRKNRVYGKGDLKNIEFGRPARRGEGGGCASRRGVVYTH